MPRRGSALGLIDRRWLLRLSLRQFRLHQAGPSRVSVLPGTGNTATHRTAALDPRTGLDFERRIRGDEHVTARAELDQTDSLPAFDLVAGLEVADDAARQQPCNLLEGDLVAIAVDLDEGLLVGEAGLGIHGVHETAFAILDQRHRAGDGRPVYMHVEHVQKDAQAQTAAQCGFYPFGFGDYAVGGRNDGARRAGDGAGGIAEEPQEKQCQHDRRKQQPPGVREHPDYPGDHCEPEPIPDSILHHNGSIIRGSNPHRSGVEEGESRIPAG